VRQSPARARLLLDTQTLLKAHFEGIESFSRKLRSVLESPLTELCISSLSISEMAIKASIKKLNVSSADVSLMISGIPLTVLPFTGAHAERMFQLPLHHRDPLDRMLIAVALAEDIPVATGDREFSKYAGLKVIW